MADPTLASSAAAAPAAGPDASSLRRLARIELPDASPLPSAYAEADRSQAVADLLMDNRFDPDGVEGGPFVLHLCVRDGRLEADGDSGDERADDLQVHELQRRRDVHRPPGRLERQRLGDGGPIAAPRPRQPLTASRRRRLPTTTSQPLRESRPTSD